MQPVKKSKGEATRVLILETALRLFRERGFEETTMRVIADEAGVSLGNAYYYFRSKDELIHAFYVRLQGEQLTACEGILATERSLKNRISGTIRAQIAVVTPYHRLFLSLFRIAADPANPLNPFNEGTQDVRERCIQHFNDVLLGSDDKVPADLQAELPFLLWMYYMGIMLFWMYDSSDGHVRTYRLLELSAEMIANLVSIASMPIMIPARKSMLKMIKSLKEV